MLIPKSILVISLRRLGDALLATPIIHSLKQAYPDATIDVCVFECARHIFKNNSDVSNIIMFPGKASTADFFKIIRTIFKKYDLSIATQSSDRASILALLSGKKCSGILDKPKNEFWKKPFFSSLIKHDSEQHTVIQNLKLIAFLNIPQLPVVKIFHSSDDAEVVNQKLDVRAQQPYVVIHPTPMYNYKKVSASTWQQIIIWLIERNYKVIFTGSDAASEMDYINSLIKSFGDQVINLAGQLNFNELAVMIKKSRCYIGIDTSVSHIAAATGVPCLIFFGPSSPVQWAPWPYGYGLTQPWQLKGTQVVNNVYLLQNDLPCVPCLNEGCENNLESYSDCLMTLPMQALQGYLEEILVLRKGEN